MYLLNENLVTIGDEVVNAGRRDGDTELVVLDLGGNGDSHGGLLKQGADAREEAEGAALRIEVTDTGCGIRPKDMVQSKLFCECFLRLIALLVTWRGGSADSRVRHALAAFNQTEQGRLQGGKGTGLGLALVRQIVKLSGGRLGVKSKVNEGSTFWVELREWTSLFVCLVTIALALT